MKIRILDTLVRVCVYDDNNGIIYDKWEHVQQPEKEPEEMGYKIQRRVMIGGVVHNVRANTEQDYADKIGYLTLTANSKKEQEYKNLTRVNFGKYAKRWYALYCQNLAEATQRAYSRNLTRFIYPVLERYYIDEITPEAVQEAINAMGDKAQATKQKMLMILKQILDAAVEDKIIESNPAKSKRIKKAGKKSTPRKPYTVEQMQYITANLHKIKNTRDKAYIALIALHPLRPEEVLGLKWEDINFTNNTITIKRAVTHPDRNRPIIKEPKTEESGRAIGLTQKAREVLQEYKSNCNTNGFIFGDDIPFSYSVTRKLCDRVKKDLCFSESITPARFRPTVISDIYSKTGDIKLVQEAAGHANVDTTLKHYISTRKDTSRSAEAIDALYNAQQTPQQPAS